VNHYQHLMKTRAKKHVRRIVQVVGEVSSRSHDLPLTAAMVTPIVLRGDMLGNEIFAPFRSSSSEACFSSTFQSLSFAGFCGTPPRDRQTIQTHRPSRNLTQPKTLTSNP
jgi:hypothetical protein